MQGGFPMSQQEGISADLAATETLALRKAIEEFNKQSSDQTKQMLCLTRVIAWLTAVMTIVSVFQIYTTFARSG
jgi:hypothetical protein